MEQSIKLKQTVGVSSGSESSVSSTPTSTVPVIKPTVTPEPTKPLATKPLATKPLAANLVQLKYPHPKADRTEVILSNNKKLEIPLGLTQICIDNGLKVSSMLHYRNGVVIKTDKFA